MLREGAGVKFSIQGQLRIKSLNSGSDKNQFLKFSQFRIKFLGPGSVKNPMFSSGLVNNGKQNFGNKKIKLIYVFIIIILFLFFFFGGEGGRR